jgi:TrpR-related protein YerC/YecD
MQELFKAISGLESRDEVKQFFTDLCTPAELMAMADRWKAARLLRDGLSYREIYEKSGVSTATVTRVARCLTLGAGGYRLALERLAPQRKL